jgi:spectinomycin phosphotransferase
MSAEPTLEHDTILSCLRVTYGLHLETLTFIPTGTAPAYRTEGRDGRYFLKLVPNTGYGAGMLERVVAEVPLMRALAQYNILTRVPQLVLTLSGADVAFVEDHGLLVYDWIEATNLSNGWSSALLELASLIGRLHASTAQITSSVPRLPVPPEDFGLPFETRLLENLQRLNTLPKDARAGVHALRELLQPYQGELEWVVERAKLLQHAVVAQPRDFVVCHTDAHGGNVMRDGTGELWIIDWETARLAPREHDLWMLHDRLPEILPAYTEALGRDVKLNLDVLEFYFHRRVLEDIDLDINMILFQNTRPEEDAANLEIIKRYKLPSFDRMETDFERLKALLDGI